MEVELTEWGDWQQLTEEEAMSAKLGVAPEEVGLEMAWRLVVS